MTIVALIHPLYTDKFNTPDNAKSWLFLVIVVLIILIVLAIIAYWEVHLFLRLLMERKVRKTLKTKGIIHYGLLLANDLVYRELSIGKPIILIPRKNIRRTEWHSERIEKTTSYSTYIIYYDEDDQTEYSVEIAQHDLNKKYTADREVYTLVNNWK